MNSNKNYPIQFFPELLSPQQLIRIKGGVEDKRATRPGTKSNTKTNTDGTSSTKKP